MRLINRQPVEGFSLMLLSDFVQRSFAQRSFTDRDSADLLLMPRYIRLLIGTIMIPGGNVKGDCWLSLP